MKKRLDMLLVERGLFPTRAKAQAAIMAGKVKVKGRPQIKAGMEIPAEIEISIAPDACPYVSRGGLKLAAALEQFHVDVSGRVALDVGSSTGGFTDCLLQQGAARVYAVDVGTKQLDSKLRNDPRVVLMEQTHIRDLRPEQLDPKPDMAVVDVSFISLTKVLTYITECLTAPHPNTLPSSRGEETLKLPPLLPGEGGVRGGIFDFIALIKPQFELEPKKAPKGIVRKAEHHEEAIEKIRAFAKELRLEERGLIESPLHGAKGNKEFLIHLIK